MRLMHLAECQPEQHPEWTKSTHRAGLDAGAVLCIGTAYMASELYPDEDVWTEDVADVAGETPPAVVELAVALEQAKAHWDHADAPYDPDLLTLFRATEKVLALFSNGDGQQPPSLIE